MSTETNDFEIPEDMKDKPVPFNFFVNVTSAIESRVDYNFNSIIQVSLLLEYLYDQLEEKDISIPLDEKFAKFAEARMEEIQQQFQASVQEKTEQAKTDAEELVEQINMSEESDEEE